MLSLVQVYFPFFSIIFSYTVSTTMKNKTKQTNTQTNKQLLLVQSAPVKEYYGVFRQDQLLVVGECKQARSCQPWRLKNVGLLLTCASFNFFQKFIVLQRAGLPSRKTPKLN